MSNPFDNIRRRIELISREYRTKKFLTSIAKRMADLIRTRTLLGKDSFNRPFPGLERSTKDQRGRINLDSRTTKGKDNLTRSGKLMDSITGRAVGNHTAQVYLKENRGDGVTNENLEKYHREGIGSKKGKKVRHFLDLAPSEKDNIQRYIRGEVLKSVRKSLK